MNPVAGARIASRTQLRNFTRLCNASSGSAHTVLNELFCTLVRQLHVTWKSMCSEGECSIMDFSEALREVYDSNAAFWRTGHTGLADLNELLTDSRRDRVDGTNISARLRGIMAEALKDTLDAVDSHISQAITAFEKVLGGRKASMLVYPDTQAKIDPQSYGSYMPPSLPQVETRVVKKGSWLAKPIEDFDLDAFFGEVDASDVAEAGKISATPTSGPDIRAGPDNRAALQQQQPEDATPKSGVLTDAPAEDVVSALVAAESQISGPTEDKASSMASLEGFLDLDVFFRDWGLNDNDQGPIKLVHDELHVEQHKPGNIKDLDAFLESCLVVPEHAAA